MANIKLEIDHTLRDGELLTFKAPCNCNTVDGIKVCYPGTDGVATSKVFAFTDAHGNALTGVGDLFITGAHIAAVFDTTNNKAYLLNADTNQYLEGSKAPAGYGLGVENAPYCEDVDYAFQGGFFSVDDLSGWPNRMTAIGSLLVIPCQKYDPTTQILFDKEFIERRCWDDHEMEWTTPVRLWPLTHSNVGAAQRPLYGRSSDIAPSEVAEAVKVGRPVAINVGNIAVDGTTTEVTFTNFSYSDTYHVGEEVSASAFVNSAAGYQWVHLYGNLSDDSWIAWGGGTEGF